MDVAGGSASSWQDTPVACAIAPHAEIMELRAMESLGRTRSLTSTGSDAMWESLSSLRRVTTKSSHAAVIAMTSAWRWPERPGEMPLYVQRSFRMKAFGLIGLQLVCILLESLAAQRFLVPRLDAAGLLERAFLGLGCLAVALIVVLNMAAKRFPVNYALILSTTVVVGVFWGIAPPLIHASLHFQLIGVLAASMLLSTAAVALLTRQHLSGQAALSMSVLSGWASASCLDLLVVQYWDICPLGVAGLAIAMALVLLVLALLLDAGHLLTKCNPDDFALVVVSMDSALLVVSLPILIIACRFLHRPVAEPAASEAAAPIEHGAGLPV